ncbi:MAG: hypothetical protein D3916_07645 [Candidatus Electrothrix sp. MAN1_4]|nr:hypothetical protein [Candidatus Electrothrix sp. MAN1_4]
MHFEKGAPHSFLALLLFYYRGFSGKNGEVVFYYGVVSIKNGEVHFEKGALVFFLALHDFKKVTVLSLLGEGLFKKAQPDLFLGPVRRIQGGYDVDWKCTQIAQRGSSG